ncbi:hypothetical protein NDU88_002709 [Pleurodeles waltl]|uniref:Uncharacterized protein n=1 Tax=Pleurodeles waltl TaxID=8319 RepID=A0AAV7VF61_PLEWA|nr:hypothetical protein NDU88_002709 [Pleurodeles waltl]
MPTKLARGAKAHRLATLENAGMCHSTTTSESRKGIYPTGVSEKHEKIPHQAPDYQKWIQLPVMLMRNLKAWKDMAMCPLIESIRLRQRIGHIYDILISMQVDDLEKSEYQMGG